MTGREKSVPEGGNSLGKGSVAGGTGANEGLSKCWRFWRLEGEDKGGRCESVQGLADHVGELHHYLKIREKAMKISKLWWEAVVSI